MPVHSIVVGVPESFEPQKDSPDKGKIVLKVKGDNGEQQRKEFPYKRMSPDVIPLHIGAWTTYNVVDGVITGLHLR